MRREFKPDNAMLGDAGRVRVLDFGLSRRIAPDPGGLRNGSPRSTRGASRIILAGSRVDVSCATRGAR